MSEKIVLAFSGGLDTSYCVLDLVEKDSKYTPPSSTPVVSVMTNAITSANGP